MLLCPSTKKYLSKYLSNQKNYLAKKLISQKRSLYILHRRQLLHPHKKILSLLSSLFLGEKAFYSFTIILCTSTPYIAPNNIAIALPRQPTPIHQLRDSLFISQAD